jgi:hypothetical protein
VSGSRGPRLWTLAVAPYSTELASGVHVWVAGPETDGPVEVIDLAFLFADEAVELAARGVDQATGPGALTQDECEFYARAVLAAVVRPGEEKE